MISIRRYRLLAPVKTLFLLLLVFLLVGANSQVIFALTNNVSNIDPRVITTMANGVSAWEPQNMALPPANVTGPGNPCVRSPFIVQGQPVWVSQAGSPGGGNTATITEGQDTLPLQYNVAGVNCDYIVDGSGKINQNAIGPDGKKVAFIQNTGYNITAASYNVNGGAPRSVNGIVTSSPLNLDYNSSYFYNNRVVKPNVGNFPGDLPLNKQFNLAGLSGLKEGDYQVTVTISTIPVNLFKGTGTYTCVVNASQHPVDLLGHDKNNKQICEKRDDDFVVQLHVKRAWTGTCSVTVPARVEVGKPFKAKFTVTNTGTKDWSTYFMKLGSGSFRPGVAWTEDFTYDNTVWGQSRQTIKEEFVNNGFPEVRSGKSSTWTTGAVFTAPTQPGTRNFVWRILQESPADQQANYPNKEILGACSQTVEVYQPEDRPFITVEGGDVISGAAFSTGGVCTPSDKAKQASIHTSGSYAKTGLKLLYGSSAAQYAVYASGDIGDVSNDDAHDTFVGNFGYYRNSLDSVIGAGYVGNSRDALFSVIGSGSSSAYGHYYSDSASPAVPCVDVTNERAKAGANSVDATTAKAFITNNASGTVGYTGDLTLPGVTGGVIPPGVHKTLVVSGTVTLTSNIQGQPSYVNAEAVSSLTIIAKNINIQANTQIVDANLIASPDNTNTGGILDTCSDLTAGGVRVPGQWPTSLTVGSCKRSGPSLRITGSVSARRILWKRTYGTLGTTDGAADPSCALTTVALSSGDPVSAREQCSSELIQYSPLNTISQFTNGGGGTIDAVPVSSQELPPIY